MEQSKKVAAIIGVGSLLLLVGLLTNAWFAKSVTVGEHTESLSIGLTTMEMCQRGQCVEGVIGADDFKVPDKDKAWMYFGKFTKYAGFLALLFAVVAAGLTLVGNRKAIPAQVEKSGRGFVSSVLLTGIIFIVLKPELLEQLKVGVGYSAILFMIGAVVAFIGLSMSADDAVADAAGDGAAAPAAPFEPEPAPAAPAAPAPEPAPEAASADEGGEDEENEG